MNWPWKKVIPTIEEKAQEVVGHLSGELDVLQSSVDLAVGMFSAASRKLAAVIDGHDAKIKVIQDNKSALDELEQNYTTQKAAAEKIKAKIDDILN